MAARKRHRRFRRLWRQGRLSQLLRPSPWNVELEPICSFLAPQLSRRPDGASSTGFDPITFLHADTLDSSRNRLSAVRSWVEVGHATSAWSGRVGALFLSSRNRNFLAGDRDQPDVGPPCRARRADPASPHHRIGRASHHPRARSRTRGVQGDRRQFRRRHQSGSRSQAQRPDGRVESRRGSGHGRRCRPA